jgi:glutathione S-transferase
MPNPLIHNLNVATSVLASTLAQWRGTSVTRPAQTPRRRLKLYDMEGCPYCRRVREVLTVLGLDVEIYPCPGGGQRYRAEVASVGGKMQFPFLVDPNTNAALYESSAIIDYLFETYAHSPTPRTYQASVLQAPAGSLSTALRAMRGLTYRKAKAPRKPLALWSFESSPYARLVRERLTELELPYVLHNLAKEQRDDMGPAVFRLQQLKRGGTYHPKPGGKREKVLAARGRVQVPYLEDPNTATKLYESAAIIDYLEGEYALG